MEDANTIGDYLVQELQVYGVEHVFGIPGDYILAFFDKLAHSKIKLVNSCDEQGAGFMADAYARMRGLGVVCITYDVGGLKVVNTTAQAYAEKSPVVVISGAPGIKEREKFPLLHHKVHNFDTQQKVFEQITIASTVLNDPQTASAEINRVLSAALRYKLPVYIELPRDMVSATMTNHHDVCVIQQKIGIPVLKESLIEAVKMINKAKKPVIIAGVEIHRFGLQDQLLQLIKKTNIPVAATVLSKSVISELHPQYLGIYEGVMGNESVLEYVESSDCLIILGTLMTDIYLNIFASQIYNGQAIYITNEKLSIGHHDYENVNIRDFLHGLTEFDIKRRDTTNIPHPQPQQDFSAIKGQKITVQRLFQRVNSFLKDNTIVLADVGDALFGAVDLLICNETKFLSSSYYASLGFAVPGSIGAQLANPNLRPLVLVGDGAFQMTGIELGAAVRYNLNPIVIVLNNRGYGTERVMIDGSFNDVLSWNYSLIPELVGGGKGYVVDTEEQLDEALLSAEKYTEGFCILDVHLDQNDRSPALNRIANLFAVRAR